MEQLSELARITVLSPLVTRILGCNPGKFTLQGTNTYLIGQGNKRLLLDTGEGLDEYTGVLSEYIKENKIEIAGIIVSHYHGDHVGGVSSVLNLVGRQTPVYKYPYPSEDEKYNLNITHALEDGKDIGTSVGVSLRGFHTPGHAPDHFVFILGQENAMFTADNILGEGTSVFQDLHQYMGSLKRMLEVGSWKLGWLYPGHGPVVKEGLKKIEDYIWHRQQRENDVIRVLKEMTAEKSAQQEGITVEDIVSVIYKDYPRNLWPAAQMGIHQHLLKLLHDNRVSEVRNDQWILNKL